MKFFDYFYRDEFTLEAPRPRQWDTFLSSWDGSERVHKIFAHVQAKNKFWIIHPEYKIRADKLPDGQRIEAAGGEAASIKHVIAQLETLGDITTTRLCVDITGMLRPQIAILVRMLKQKALSCSMRFIHSQQIIRIGSRRDFLLERY